MAEHGDVGAVRVGVFYTPHTTSLMDLIDAAADQYTPVVINAASAPLTGDASDLTGLIPFLESAGVPEEHLVRQLEALSVSGVMTLDDMLLPTAARVAAALGLPFHDAQTAAALARKDVQRQRLNAAGVSPVRCATASDASQLEPAAAAVGFPAVVKPVSGNGSRNVFHVDDLAELRAAVRSSGATGDTLWQVEERLVGVAHPGAAWLGDYVSVESLALGYGRYWHLCVTDRLPVAWPLRETGLLVPSSLPPDLRASVCELIDAALAALGVDTGVTHTEVKLTAGGPRIIEVNGRVGGFLRSLLARCASFDPYLLAMQASVSAAVAGPDLSFSGFALALLVHAPVDARRVRRLADERALRAIPGVWRIDEHIPVGGEVDYRTGTPGRIRTVWIHASTLDDLREAQLRVQQRLARDDRFEEVNDDG